MNLTPQNNNLSDLRGSASIVEEVSDNVTYVGFCNIGDRVFESDEAAEDAPIWCIQKVTTSGIVKPIVTRMQFADGLAAYSQRWSQRAAYTYKHLKL